ncbi:phosphatase PAP2 family protein [Pseudorhizobium endolithicum]|uniref:Phosphatase PAP2 family protein n=1 Tax=Pseudorhizobium endolithicum TaxID=1191678 RepID=A0ABN7JEX4_9HYPH|nr:phosphatase PAP2 family protein [Pseudorhizobium endolithicum]CAD6411392.1 phosphatase PAP2 family protein [Rhizobium sp. Q54]CAD7023863.1 phosphatase PAP2 family protein [Pseudorhizobium endolithicum]
MAFHQRVSRKIVDRIMTFEPVSLILFAVAAGGLFLFLQLTGEVIEGDTHAFDERLLLLLRSADDPATPIGPYWLSHAMDDITALGGTAVLSLMTIMVTGYLLLARRRAIAVFTLASVAGGWALSAALKLGVARPRPDIVPHLVEVYDLSFPSGHAMVSAATYLTLGALLSRAQPTRVTRLYMIGVAVFLTFIIGLSRVFLGVHYPTDVLGGWCAGATWALVCWLVARRYIAQTPG